MRIKKLLFLIPVVALLTVVLFAVGSPSEAFADTPALSLGDSFEVEYGDFILNEAQWVYDSVDDVFVSYGNIEAGVFAPMSPTSSNSNGEYYQYKCKLNLYIVDSNGELEAQSGSNKFSKPYDENGLCNIAPNKTYTVGAGYTKQKGAFATLTAINASGEETGTPINLERYSTQILTIKVKQRAIIIDVNLVNSFGFDSSSIENGILSLSRTYSIDSALKLVINEGNNLVFNHQFLDFAFNSYDNVGDYPEFVFNNDNIKIMLGETDVTAYYKISSKYSVKLTVNKLIIVAPTYNFENIYKQGCILKENLVIDGNNISVPISDYDLKNLKFGSNNSTIFGNENLIHYFYNDSVNKNSDLQVEYSYSINATLDALFPALSDEVSVYSLYVADNYTCTPILNKVIYYDTILDNSNFEIRQGDLSTFKINKKTIMLYAENTVLDIEPADGESFIAVSTEAFSHPYGKAYSERSTTTVWVDTTGDGVLDSEITVTFRIKEFQSFLANQAFYSIDGKVILNKGEYAIDPETIDDFRYNATIHESLHYTVTAKELLLSDLLSASEFINTVEVVDGLYVINNYAYGTPSTEYSTVDLSFTKRLPDEIGENESMLPDPIAFSVRFAFDINSNQDSMNNVTPGIYRATSVVDNNYNYSFADLTVDNQMVVAIRINKKEITASIGDKEYDGETVNPTIEGTEEGNAYEVNIEYSKGNSFRTAVNPPVDSGTYTARIKLVEGSIYEFANHSDYVDITFKINKRAVIVRVESKGIKTFGTTGYFKNPTNSNIATYTVRHATDSTKVGVVGNDSLGALFSKAADQGAKPGVYNIETSKIKNANYDIKFEYPKNARKATIEVTKLKQVTTDIKFTARQANPKTTGQTITVSEFTLWDNVIPVVITYMLDGEYTDANVAKVSGGYQISSLLEGTNYEIRYTIPKDNDYLDLGEDYILLELAVSTDLTEPDWYQAMDKLATDNVIINVKNYQADNYFASIQDDGVFEYGLTFDIPTECISFVYNSEDAAVIEYAVFDLGKAITLSSENVDGLAMTANSTFNIRVSRRTDDKELDISKVRAREIYTIATKPDIKKSDIAVDTTSITLPTLAELPEGSTYVLSYIKGEIGKSTISSLVDSDVDLTEVFNNPENEIVYADGLSINSIDDDTIYYIRVYVVKDIDEMVSPDGTTINSVVGKPIYFELHTPKAQEEAPATNFLLKISGYIGIGTMGVLAVLLIMLGIIYAMLRRKWRIR